MLDPNTSTPEQNNPPHLRLVQPVNEAPRDVLPFERRACDRKRMVGQVTGIVLAEEENPKNAGCTREKTFRSNKIAGFHLQDRSETGMGLLSQEPVESGHRITVFVPPHGAEPGEDITGKVVRCDSIDGGSGSGYWVGIELARAFTSRSA